MDNIYKIDGKEGYKNFIQILLSHKGEQEKQFFVKIDLPEKGIEITNPVAKVIRYSEYIYNNNKRCITIFRLITHRTNYPITIKNFAGIFSPSIFRTVNGFRLESYDIMKERTDRLNYAIIKENSIILLITNKSIEELRELEN